VSCSWPFHSDPDCKECETWEVKYGATLDHWLEQRQEVRSAAKAARRKTTPPTETV
jgi:hypothetical protein